MSLDLKQVPIPGWADEDGEQVTSAVVITGAVQGDDPLSSAVEKYRNSFIDAWEKTGRMEFENAPYITRELLKNYLIEDEGMNMETVKKALSTGEYRMIGALVKAKIIEPRGVGWAVIDSLTYSVMMLRAM